MRLLLGFCTGLIALWCSASEAAAPVLYRQADYESPVHAAPDDLLLLAGYGLAASDVVIYAAVADTTHHLLPPVDVPLQSTAARGMAPIVSGADVPYSVTIKMPAALHADQSYALWVRTADGDWSAPVLINDARPLWITPAYAYATAATAGLPRLLKAVGRNLQPASGHRTQLRLLGPHTVLLTASDGQGRSETAMQYIQTFPLPNSLTPGKYKVQLSRDGASWVDVTDQALEIRPDPEEPELFSVSDPKFGGCHPDDGIDDTPCIVRALEAAHANGHGAVWFGSGVWDIVDPHQPGVNADEGMLVLDGVELRGAGSDVTRLARHVEWNRPTPAASFTLFGHNKVSGFTFSDLQVYQPQDRVGSFFAVGQDFNRVASAPHAPGTVGVADDIVVTHNVFDKTFIALRDAGLPIDHLIVTYNEFGAYLSALELGGNRYNMAFKYRIDDSVVDFNVFKPSSRLSMNDRSGAIASELGAGQRVDFSGNTADGSSTEYLYASTDPRGWRAAFFWNLDGNVEQTLVSNNVATCTGDKIGDGEAIAFDNNGNSFAFGTVATVSRAGPHHVTVDVPLTARQNGYDVPPDYYVGHWLRIVSGPGVGEVRRITAYVTDPVTRKTSFSIRPDWDVLPAAGVSRISVGREFWQVFTVDNRIDHRQPLCQKSNRSRPDGGVITMWGPSADSVIAGNRQFDTDGILFQQAYVTPEKACAECTMEAYWQSFLEVRGNEIDGEYDWSTNCSSSGIQAGIAAAPWNDSDPPTVGFGVSISHNSVTHAAAPRGGAIALVSTWHAGPEPHRWPLSDNLLLFHNLIRDSGGTAPLALCGPSAPRAGVAFPPVDIAWRTVLYANSCKDVAVPIAGGGTGTVRVCPSGQGASCECPAP